MSPASPLSMQRDHERRMGRTMEIIALYQDGVPVLNISDEFECSRTTVLRLARIFGLPKRSKKTIPEGTRTAVLADWDAGLPLAEIARSHGVSEAWVSIFAANNGRRRYKAEPQP